MRGAAIHCLPSVRKGTSIVEHISGSSSFKLGREPEEEALKASELNVDFEGKSSSDTGRNLRQGSECPGRVLGLALGLRWRAGAKPPLQNKERICWPSMACLPAWLDLQSGRIEW